MMGVSHATTGAAAGLALASLAPDALGTHTPAGVLVFGLVCAGFALLPDLDHPTSTATRRFGPASMLASAVVRPLSAFVFRLTATRRDRGGGRHRYLTHTVVAAVGLGWLVNLAVTAWGTHAVWTVVFVASALAVKGIDHLIPGPPSLLAAAALTGLVVLTAGDVAPWIGVAVGVGMLVHAVGDALTEGGAPLLAPLPIGGRTWAPIRPPRALRFRTGGAAETVLLVVATAAVVWLVVDAVPAGREVRSVAWEWLTEGLAGTL